MTSEDDQFSFIDGKCLLKAFDVKIVCIIYTKCKLYIKNSTFVYSFVLCMLL